MKETRAELEAKIEGLKTMSIKELVTLAYDNTISPELYQAVNKILLVKKPEATIPCRSWC